MEKETTVLINPLGMEPKDTLMPTIIALAAQVYSSGSFWSLGVTSQELSN